MTEETMIALKNLWWLVQNGRVSHLDVDANLWMSPNMNGGWAVDMLTTPGYTPATSPSDRDGHML